MARPKITDECLIEGCTRTFYGRGLCSSHYKRESNLGRLNLYPRYIRQRGQTPEPPKPLRAVIDEMNAQLAREAEPAPCRRGCCWTPFNLCARRYGCACHTEGIAA